MKATPNIIVRGLYYKTWKKESVIANKVEERKYLLFDTNYFQSVFECLRSVEVFPLMKLRAWLDKNKIRLV